MLLHVEAFGEDIVSRELLRFAGRALDARPAWLAIQKDVHQALEKQFETEGRHASGGWEELADVTVAAKSVQGLDPRILHATLALRNSLTEATDENAVTVITSDSLSIGTDVSYGEFHMRGNDNLPKRPPVAFTELDKQGFTVSLQRYIVEGELLTGAVL